MIVDLFAGPGGWSEGLRMLAPDLHSTEIGFEWDRAACDTRAAAGHATIRTDIAAYPTEPFTGKVTGLIASPPCQDFSLAGKRAGIEGERGQLITEVLRWAEALRPEWIACEQVPPALPVWRDYEVELRKLGFFTWSGVLNAADYGVPQTRRRAILLASRSGPVAPPESTHDREPVPTLFGESLECWVSMGDALGWKQSTESEAVNTGRRWLKGGTREDAQTVPASAPAPAPTISGQTGAWWFTRPATTLVGSFCPDVIAGPGVDLTRPRQNREGSVKISITDALVLQSFPANYPLQGSKTKQFQQVGNAVPPRLAAHILAKLTDRKFQL